MWNKGFLMRLESTKHSEMLFSALENRPLRRPPSSFQANHRDSDIQ